MTERAIVILRLKDNTPENKRSWSVIDNKLYHTKNKKRTSFKCFDYAISDKTNEELFDDYFKHAVKEVCLGTNLTVFAYGQTGSGKTHSMFGNEAEFGLIYYSLKFLLKEISEVKVSFIEIYNEKIYDLIDPTSKVNLYNVYNEPRLTGNAVLKLSSVNEIEELIKKCEVNRKTSVTEYNTRSSRSHTFFEISFELNDRKVTFNLIDLAGSEKASMDKERRKEGAFINKSLLSLGTVINNLSNKDYTSFRESKLTRLLQPSMEGNSNLIALCLINPIDDCIEESISTLNFASRVGKIRFTKKEEEYTPLQTDNLSLLCEKCKLNYINKSNQKITNKIKNESEISVHQSTNQNLIQSTEIKEKISFSEMKKHRTKDEVTVLNCKNEFGNSIMPKEDKKLKQPDTESKVQQSETVSQKKVSTNFSDSPAEIVPINKEPPNTFNTEVLDFNPSKEEPIDIFNIYLTDDSKTSYYNEASKFRKKERIEEKVEYLEKKINLYQERVEELEKVVYDLIINDVDSNQKNIFNLEKKMFYCKNKILDNQYEDFFN